MGGHEAAVFVDIAAPARRVWELITDIALMPAVSEELLAVQWAEGFDGPRLGAQFLGHNRHPAVGEWTTRSQIVAFDPPRVFGWAVGDPENPSATWTFELNPTGHGTRLDYIARIGPGPSGVTALIARSPDQAERIVAARLGQFRSAMIRTLAAVRERAEDPGGLR
ncbi:MAG: SRPBCC family protein [Mycobacterium sp.]